MVSICVLAYNSEKTIIDTLDSVYQQTYSDVELIVSDDGSRDSTVSVASKWLKENGSKFRNVQLLTVTNNSGTPSNCNRAVRASNGEWIKFIAADDILLPNCIEIGVSYVLKNPKIRIFYTDYLGFSTNSDGKMVIHGVRPNPKFNEKFNTDPKHQLKVYLEQCGNISPSAFINKGLIAEVGGFIEKYKVFEDTPFFMKVLVHNVKIYHNPQNTVLYRIDTDSVTRNKTKASFYKTTFVETNLKFRKEMVFPIYKWYNFKFWIDEYSFRILYYFATVVLKNRRTKFNTYLYLFFKAINPYYLISKVYRW